MTELILVIYWGVVISAVLSLGACGYTITRFLTGDGVLTPLDKYPHVRACQSIKHPFSSLDPASRRTVARVRGYVTFFVEG